MTDGIVTLSVIWGIAVGLSSAFAFVRIHRHNPSLLRPAIIQEQSSDDQTTLNWNVIQDVTLCLAFATGISILSNLVIYLIWNVWYLDARSVGVIAIVFAITIIRQFDKSVTKIVRR